jgi:hypothetical protein
LETKFTKNIGTRIQEKKLKTGTKSRNENFKKPGTKITKYENKK